MTNLLIPGLLCDAFTWAPLLARIEAEVADLTTQDSIGQMARDCLDRHPGKLRVAGHSMGARVAMELARIAPYRVERLALLDTGIHALKQGEREKRDEIVRFAYENGMEALAARWLPPMVHEPNQTPELMQGLTDMVLRRDPDLHARQIKALVDRPDAASYLPEIACPTLLIVGRQDQWSPLAQHEEMRTLLPDARLEIVENAGHFAPVEQPETVARLVAEFFEG
ncbi:alpha/beta fold hydrolase [Maritimibacter sp. HL-12]|uniref:alpha/beta fold hydrolase n=1 Tax=Maritimibacter sp. HL-12 TaxID=1162418 RepID=UPI000A0EF070|nr:alpha/beta fold hydrolase [Maritimibacter sp. HL-12]SMH41937.1 Pimeloyl-ACP methyl ester carboxylesterase [Maritimibacter sp. HL-12]